MKKFINIIACAALLCGGVVATQAKAVTSPQNVVLTQEQIEAQKKALKEQEKLIKRKRQRQLKNSKKRPKRQPRSKLRKPRRPRKK